MTANDTHPAATGRRMNITLWVLQVLLAAFMAFASAAPKLLGESTAEEIFDDIGAGDWFRYFVGAVELAGAIGLIIPPLAGLAAIGLIGLMIGATYTNLFVIDEPASVITTVILMGLFAFIAWGRRDRTAALAERLRG